MTEASGESAVAIGDGAKATQTDALSFGVSAQATNTQAMALGFGSKAQAQYATAMGNTTIASGTSSTALGDQCVARNSYSIAGGFKSVAGGISSVALGNQCNALSGGAVSIGENNLASDSYSVAIGASVETKGAYSYAIGYNAKTNNRMCMAFGLSPTATGPGSIAIGSHATTDGASSMAIGFHAATTAKATGSFVLGNYAWAEGANSYALGYNCRTKGYKSYSIGNQTISQSAYEFVVGNGNDTISGYNAEEAVSYDRLFVVGNGKMIVVNGVDYIDKRSNAMVVYKNGNTVFNGDVLPGRATNPWTYTSYYDLGGYDDRWSCVYASEMDVESTIHLAGSLDAYYLYVDGDIDYTGALTGPSDIRLKKDVHTLTGALDKVLQLRGVSFYWKNKEEMAAAKGVPVDSLKYNFSEDKQIGVIAQEVEKEFPELVKTNENGFKSVDYTKITPVLIEAVKELKAEKDALKAEKDALEAKVEKLEAQMQQILEKLK